MIYIIILFIILFSFSYITIRYYKLSRYFNLYDNPSSPYYDVASKKIFIWNFDNLNPYIMDKRQFVEYMIKNDCNCDVSCWSCVLKKDCLRNFEDIYTFFENRDKTIYSLHKKFIILKEIEKI